MIIWRWGNFNPRSPHGERPFALQNRALFVQFQPTLPARGATSSCSGQMPGLIYFNPRSPHGERLPP